MSRRRLGAALTGAALVATGIGVLPATPAQAAAAGGVGATLPYIQVQAENAATNGTVIGPTATYGQLAAEASFRKAVTLQGAGKYVEFTTPVATNSIVFRYSIPDSAGGTAYTAPLSFSIDGVQSADFVLTNAYSWYYGSYPFTNSPGGNPHHFYDETQRLFPTTYPAGTKFRLQVGAGDSASSYTIDFADFENVAAPLGQPAGSVSITSRGADPTGVRDSTSAMNQAIAAAGAGGTVWIPPGTFTVLGHVAVDNVTIRGAGMWHSRTQGDRIGFYGNYPPTPSRNVHLADFAIFGNVRERNDGDQVNGIGGAMSDSTVDRVWIEHTKVGAWMDGPFTNLVFNQMRLRNFTADAVNFHDGVTNSRVTNSDARNAGDDALAMWAEHNADAHNSFDHNTVQYPILANGIAIYGGHDNFVTDNRVIDSGLSQGGGIHVAQRFSSTPLGRTDVLRNTIIRSGSLDPNWQFGVGALWFDARDAAMTGLTNVDDIRIQQSPYEAIQFVSGSQISNVRINNATIQNTGTFVVQEQVGGSATITDSTATGTQGPAPRYNCGAGFTLTDGGGNSGVFGASACTMPTPTFPPYLPENGAQISISPAALGFGSVATGSTSTARTVTVTNSGTAAAGGVSVSASGDFDQANACGSAIAAGASCAVEVLFRPTAAGTRTGALTITAAGVTNTVPLSGTGVAPGPILSVSPATLTFPGTVVGRTAPSQAVTVTNSGTGTATVAGVTASGDFSQSNNCATVAVGASCTVTVAFRPTAAGPRGGTVTVTSNANNSPATVAVTGSGIGPATNLAAGRPATASSQVNAAYAPGAATDGNADTYWESANNAFPQWVQVDLGASYEVGRVTLRLPPAAAWQTRTQTLSLHASTNGTTFSDAVGPTTYTFNPASANTVTIAVPGVSARYLRVAISANSGWPAGQLAELEAYPAGDDPAGTDLAAGRPASESSHTDGYGPGNVTDNNQNTYWESANNAFPQWIQVDLGAPRSASRVVLQLPAGWGARTQTLSLQGSTDGSTWTTIKASATYTFTPSANNTTSLTFPATTRRYFRLTGTANTGWPAAQLAGFQIWPD